MAYCAARIASAPASLPYFAGDLSIFQQSMSPMGIGSRRENAAKHKD
jgi:hypothetical protein